MRYCIFSFLGTPGLAGCVGMKLKNKSGGKSDMVYKRNINFGF